jgi:hypothetical protein
MPHTFSNAGTGVLVTNEPRACDVSFTADELVVKLVDGRSILIPLDWLPGLKSASDDQRRAWSIEEDGEEINWEDLDEELSVPVLLGLPH